MCVFNIGKCLFNIGMRRTRHLTQFLMRECFSFDKFSSSGCWSSRFFLLEKETRLFFPIKSLNLAARSFRVWGFMSLLITGQDFYRQSTEIDS